MRRRGYLLAGGSVAATITGAVASIRRHLAEKTTAVFQDDDTVAVRIVETNAPVDAGALLEVAIEVENRGSAAIRPDIECFFDGEQRSTVRTTIDPGETKVLDDFSFYTVPTGRDDAVTVRFETEDDAAERTVDVLAIPDLDPAQTSPDRELTVQPGTSVLFEVESEVLGEYGGGTRWFVDGEFDGQSIGPWYSAYYGHRGADHWRTSFESTGTYEVAAAIGGEDETYRATWTVRVTESGTQGPVVAGREPSEEAIEAVRGEPIELALEMAHPDGGLDRVVWWLGHADAVLGESEVSGSKDTATLELDHHCHGCPIVTWVIDENGAVTSESPWIIESVVDDPDGEVDVTIVETNDPVDTGAVLEVTAELENGTASALEREVDLVVGHDPELVDSRSVTVESGASESILLEFATAVVRRTQTFPARVETEDAADEVAVEVIGTEDDDAEPSAELAVADQKGDGETLLVERATADVEFSVEAEYGGAKIETDAFDAREIVEPAEIELDPPVADDTSIEVRVLAAETGDELAAETIAYAADAPEPSFEISSVETADEVTAGDSIDVTVEIEIVGGSAGETDVRLDIGDRESVDSESVSIAAGRTGAVTLTYSTTAEDVGDVLVTASTPDDSTSVVVSVLEPDESERDAAERDDSSGDGSDEGDSGGDDSDGGDSDGASSDEGDSDGERTDGDGASGADSTSDGSGSNGSESDESDSDAAASGGSESGSDGTDGAESGSAAGDADESGSSAETAE
ncbi:hypothetical protein [Halosolutus gelatinilyticus]|uniref:hypothetical protein n=1 Tax=Halosolutus gelatinilyticus TaxID=2931975 RepID=UPI001FF28426|nr:hypothetical protein [Halosolutus gelatinilyticus]